MVISKSGDAEHLLVGEVGEVGEVEEVREEVDIS